MQLQVQVPKSSRRAKHVVVMLVIVTLLGAAFTAIGTEVAEEDSDWDDLTAAEMSEQDDNDLDDSTLPWLQNVRSWWADWLMNLFSLMGGGKGLMILTGLAAGLLFARQRRSDAALLILALVGGGILSRGFKDALDRPRPEGGRSVLTLNTRMILALAVTALVLLALTSWRRVGLIVGGALALVFTVTALVDQWGLTTGNDSFPSGHAVGSMSVASAAVVLAWRSSKRWLVLAAATAFVAIVGLSRAYFGLHYASDILGGWLLALAWVVLVAGARAVWQDRSPMTAA